MTRDELQASLNLTQDFIPVGRPNRPGTKIKPTFLTIHNTDNTTKGADAKAHASFASKTGYYKTKSGKIQWVSWHFTVDDRQIVQHLPLDEAGWHAGKAGNAKSIGIEICMNAGIDQAAAFRRASELVALLLWDTDGATLDLGRVVPHFHWTKKKCPQLLLNSGKLGAKWQTFLASVRAVHARIA